MTNQVKLITDVVDAIVYLQQKKDFISECLSDTFWKGKAPQVQKNMDKNSGPK